eukprot:TRINITY_DN1329_c0_g1_i1.p1 TRINITY_DN1329_c0_g1~~TRINITY_DN1329_c0_g1_i1.p1  ORF type:complete len:245 (+),score=75.23 TRINITY_DN1329_c0_g1_i1:82-735(+)
MDGFVVRGRSVSVAEVEEVDRVLDDEGEVATLPSGEDGGERGGDKYGCGLEEKKPESEETGKFDPPEAVLRLHTLVSEVKYLSETLSELQTSGKRGENEPFTARAAIRVNQLLQEINTFEPAVSIMEEAYSRHLSIQEHLEEIETKYIQACEEQGTDPDTMMEGDHPGSDFDETLDEMCFVEKELEESWKLWVALITAYRDGRSAGLETKETDEKKD